MNWRCIVGGAMFGNSVVVLLYKQLGLRQPPYSQEIAAVVALAGILLVVWGLRWAWREDKRRGS